MIDYNLLNLALDFYEKKGYERVEVPWMVTEDIDAITRPVQAIPLEVKPKNKNLIASGEQGFLYQILKGYLPTGKYQTLTPCFRNDSYDLTHSKVFMKIELINTEDVSTDGITSIIKDAEELFTELFGESNINRTFEGEVWDINFRDTELGSYGFRQHKHLEWVFGTGLAEPRTSRLLKTK